MTATGLPPCTAPFDTWRAEWDRRRQRYRVPSEVFLGAGDQRMRLTLDDSAHLAHLRKHLDRQPDAILTETSDPAGWIDDRAHEVVLTLARTSTAEPKRQAARSATAASATEHHPGLSPWLYTKLYGRSDDILIRTAELSHSGWWFMRIPLHDASQFGPAAQHLGEWAGRLRSDGLLSDYTINIYRPEGRFGVGATLAAAEEVFSADSHAVLQRLLPGDRRITTAAGMIHIANAFTGNGARWLIDHIDHRAAHPTDEHPVGHYRQEVITVCHSTMDNRLRGALEKYRALVDQDGLEPDLILTDLLHLHHVRMIGLDVVSERYCLRLARATAQTLLARGIS
jgi:thiopeptide-type bacteriocin biosynthesis protein